MAFSHMTGIITFPERMLFPIAGGLIAFVVVSKLTTNTNIDENNLTG